jgi:hypothetical protein
MNRPHARAAGRGGIGRSGARVGRATMRWFRTHIGWGSRLALFALAVQLTLSFAHVHATDPGRALAVTAAPNGSGNAPSSKSDGPADPGCAICALIQLAATATPSAAPALPSLAATGHIRLVPLDQSLLAGSPRLVFRARAPPAA